MSGSDTEMVVIACVLIDEEEKRKRKRKNVWIHNICKKRLDYGECHTLFPDLFENDLADILREKCAIPSEQATSICNSFLRAFRKCPDNPAMDLDTWRHLLWAQALGDQYRNFAGEIYRKWLHLRYAYLALTPEIKSLLNKLHENYFLGLITNGPTHAQWEKINRLDLRDYFDVTLVSGDLPWEKPHARIFHEACQYLGVEPHQCIMVGDKLETDILGGIQAKLGGTVWVPLSNADLDTNKLRPDYIIEDVTSLPGLLPNSPKVPVFRRKVDFKVYKGVVSLPDLDDCNSNSSDGS